MEEARLSQKLWPILKMMEHSVQFSSSSIENSYLFSTDNISTAENGCKTKAIAVLG